MGTVWLTGCWAADTWAANTWADASTDVVFKVHRGLLMGVY